MPTIRVAGLLILLGSLATPAAAVTTYSPPLRSSDGDVLSCIVQNLSNDPVEVQADLENGLGTIIDSGTLVIEPGRAITVARTTDAVFAAYCVFTFEGRSDEIRGYIQLYDLGGSNTRLLFAASGGSGPVLDGITVVSPPIRSSQGDVLSCVAQNLTNAAVLVQATIHNGLGGTVGAGGMLNVQPGRAQVLTSTTAAVFGAYCSFTFDGDVGAVRGYIQLYDFGGSNTRLLAAASLTRSILFAEELDGGPAGGIPLTRSVSPAIRSSEGDVLSCVVQNLAEVSVLAEVEIHNGLGAVVDSGMLQVPSGRSLVVVSTTAAVFGAYCDFRINASSTAARGFIQLYDLGGSNTRLLFRAGGAELPVALPLVAGDGDIVAGRGAAGLQSTFTPPLRSSDGDVLSCRLQNLSDAAVDVDVELHNGLNAVVASGSLTVPAGFHQSIVSTTQAVFGAYCEFRFDGFSDEVRGYVELQDLGGSNTRLLFAAAQARGVIVATPTPTETPSPTATAPAVPSGTATATATVPAVDTATPTLPADATATPTVPVGSTATATPTVSVGSTATATPTVPVGATATATRTSDGSTPTATGGVPPACVGDCDGSGEVSISELIRLVNIALGAPVADCPAGDRDGDGEIGIDELVAAVNNALNGCPL